MFKLLKKLFSTKDGARTVVLLNTNASKEPSSYRVHPINLWLLCLGVLAALAGIIALLIFYTPLGGLVQNGQHVRDSVIVIQQRVDALQDTLDARDKQIKHIQQVIASGADTSFNQISPSLPAPVGKDRERQNVQWQDNQPADFAPQYLPDDALLTKNLFKNSPLFPAPYPVDGTNTRRFDVENAHFGLDIAASEGAAFRAIADGVILNQEWTFNYGFIILVQHADGYMSIYKHAQSTDQVTGATVRRGDVLGIVGDVGVLSSGPHLHLEIWENGFPKNPENYLTK